MIDSEIAKESKPTRNYKNNLVGLNPHANKPGILTTAIPGALRNDNDPQHIYSKETPAHRLMTEMAAAGYTPKEIAIATDRNAVTVRNVIRQPHARELIVERTKQTAQQDIRAFLAAEVMPSLEKLKQLRDDETGTVPKAVVKASADSLLDRFMGKPNQPITVSDKPVESLSDEELRKEIEQELTSN